ncbi:MAG: hypothetical protein NVS3B12_03330 [Acidimicrobiales bacterium]
MTNGGVTNGGPAEIDGIEIVLPPEPASATRARHFVARSLEVCGPELVEPALLLTTELATNAVLHAATDFRVTVRVSNAGGHARVELTDGSPIFPARRRFSDQAGTGRGLKMVEALSQSWGVESTPPGKTVFFEVDAGSPQRAVPCRTRLWEGAGDEANVHHNAGALVEICLSGLPLDVARRATEYYAELLREFALITERQPDLATRVPGRLLAVVDELTKRFDTFATAPRQRIAEGQARGDRTVDVEFRMPPSAGPGAARLDRLLDDADDYCRHGTSLLTLAAPAEVVHYRRWYLDAVITQCARHPPVAFDDWG